MSGKAPAEGLINWARSTAWAALMDQVITEHLGPACEDAEVDLEELPALIDDAHMSNLFGCAIESFMSTPNDDGLTVVDDYLKRRGWKETARTRDYVKAIRDSAPSVYEISEIEPGVGFQARDLMRGGAPLRISEKLGSTGMRPWTRIYARVVTVRETTMLTGSILVLDFELASTILKLLRKTAKQLPDTVAELAATNGIPQLNAALDRQDMTGIILAGATRHVCRLWLRDLLYQILDAPLPTLANTDGDLIDLQTLHFALRPTARPDEVRAALARTDQIALDADDVWTWADTKPVADDDGAQVRETVQGATIRGTITLKERRLDLFVNSERRAREGKAILEVALAGLVHRPIVEHQSSAQALTESIEDASPKVAGSQSGLSTDEERAAIRTYVDQHCHKILDQPIPLLGGKSPRDAVKGRRGCEKTVLWLKRLENKLVGLGPGNEPLDYDFTWMWEELGIAAKRK